MSRGCLCNSKSVPYANSLKGRIKKELKKREKLGNRKRWCYANEEQEWSRLRRREAGNERRRGGKTQENLKRQTGTTKWTEDERRSSGVPREKVWWKKKKGKKVPKIETRSDRRKKKRVCKKRGCLCLGVTFSAGGGLRNNGGKDGGMKGQKGGGQPNGR